MKATTLVRSLRGHGRVSWGLETASELFELDSEPEVKAPETAAELKAFARECVGFARENRLYPYCLSHDLVMMGRTLGAMGRLFDSFARNAKHKERRKRKEIAAFQWNLDQLQRRDRPTVFYCNACTRRGTLCRMKAVPGRLRCRLHGGLSTGPKTDDGRARIAESNRRRAAARRAKCHAMS